MHGLKHRPVWDGEAQMVLGMQLIGRDGVGQVQHIGKEEQGVRLVVEYDELLTEDRRRKLTEIIPVGRGVDGVRGPSRSSLKSPPNRLRALIRPLPPSTPDATELTWKSGLWVDVRHNDGVDPTAFGRLGESKPAAVGVQYPPDAGVEYKERAEDTPPFESGLVGKEGGELKTPIPPDEEYKDDDAYILHMRYHMEVRMRKENSELHMHEVESRRTTLDHRSHVSSSREEKVKVVLKSSISILCRRRVPARWHEGTFQAATKSIIGNGLGFTDHRRLKIGLDGVVGAQDV
ncbi:hypothetical protein AXG93_4783s1020 [Marchantia polymorpha subsp. ruderalis]|uniref:Uncharacterized protein n=1 Tax=Marchantia polymorpha subsp. ruderalis TaxID=1480154 RepID=A0A176WL64_MARPO|nr:hypothetical protein AXG93_4783s1020 [Marchantia polymorpha subsp. ruderalis]